MEYKPIFQLTALLSSWGSKALNDLPCGYLVLPLPQLKFSTAITVSAWARMGSTPNEKSTILCLDSAGTDSAPLSLSVSNTTRTLIVDVPGDFGGEQFGKKPPFTGYDPKFAHVALVWDPANNESRLYLDGTLKALGVITDGAACAAGNLNDVSLIIGYSKYQKRRVNSWDGQIGDVRVYDRAFKNADIKALYGVGAPPFATPTAFA
ncbi:hypothetical protein NLJ89_g7915 [Agrocybe chaxingu]|uniref:Uncharacterized protein n=1 Tax=Agrocybe chaxingu TaxID=84603 RepID=A0A9W8JWF9_9AGAR|nr:hypothetical protein NLJ89_g7915 [Agrocybe chaxingu]